MTAGDSTSGAMPFDDGPWFEPPLFTAGSTRCGGSHYARAVHDPDGAISWRCVRCGMERVIADGRGWR